MNRQLPTVAQIRDWAQSLGFQKAGIADIDLEADAIRLTRWLEAGYHGEMHWMADRAALRVSPDELVPGCCRVISVRMDYLPEAPECSQAWLHEPGAAFVARYALGRDYHKLMRRRLQQLADLIQAQIGPFGYRVFVDSAPVMEKALAAKAGLGWIGKHTNLIDSRTGSWFFLGEILTDLPLPLDQPVREHCGQCTACMTVCPTAAIVAPYVLDARRCIAYLTIELQGSIPEVFRPAIGNRIFGCDDCQQVCPWNRFARMTAEVDFLPRHGLETAELLVLAGWSEDEFLKKTEGSALRRLGYVRWLRNLAVALGNASGSPDVVDILLQWSGSEHALVAEHATWALRRHATAGS